MSKKPTGCVYFYQCGDGGPIKIGFTEGDPDRRAAQWSTGSPYPPILLGTTISATEAAIHEQFKHLRTHGEWFRADKDLLDYIAQHTIPPAPPPKRKKQKPPPSLELSEAEDRRRRLRAVGAVLREMLIEKRQRVPEDISVTPSP